MTHHMHPNRVGDLVELLIEHGFDGMAQAMQLLLNECMKIERQSFLGSGGTPRAPAMGVVAAECFLRFASLHGK